MDDNTKQEQDAPNSEENTKKEGPTSEEDTNQKGPTSDEDTQQNRPTSEEDTNQKGPTSDEDTNQKGPTSDEDTNQKGPTSDEDTNQKGPTSDKDTKQKGPTSDEDTNQKGPTSDEDTNQKGPTSDEDTKQNGPTSDEDTKQNGPTSDEDTNQKGPTFDEDTQQNGPTSDEDTQQKTPASGEDTAQKVSTKRQKRTFKRTSNIRLPIQFEPLCARELLLSKACFNALATANKTKGTISFVLIVITLVIFAISHALISILLSQSTYFNTLRLLQTFDFQHVRTPCAIIKDLDTKKKNLVFYALPYASYSHRFEESNFMENFLDCFEHYYFNPEKAMVSFEKGAFFWSYGVMVKLGSDKSSWQAQLQRPDSSEIVGSAKSLCLSVSTPQLNEGRRPVIVLVTGNDLVYNKPIMPAAQVVESLDCVVVTVNYRIGLDGAAILNRDNFMGNLFIRDVTQALLWINKTIDSFGGDARRVVFLGEGSGGTLGLWLLLSPEAVYVNKFWLIDPSPEILPLSGMGSILEDVFLQEPSPLFSLAWNISQDQIDECYKKFKHNASADCLNHLSQNDTVRVMPQWLRTVHSYLDEFPEMEARQVTERSLLHLPPTILNSSLLAALRDKSLKMANKSVVFFSSSASGYYWSMFPTGRRNESRFKVETGFRRSLERVYAKRNTQRLGSTIVQHYVDLMKSEVNEDEIDYEQMRRMLLYDIRTVCPVQALMYHLLFKNVISAPMFNIFDISSYQTMPLYVGNSKIHCNLPRFLLHSFDDDSADACRFAFNIGDEGMRQLNDYRAVTTAILADFAHDRVRDLHHKQHLVAAVGSSGGDVFESTMNILDHRGSQAGMDTKRSQHIKSVCHELYGAARDDWHVLMYMSRFN